MQHVRGNVDGLALDLVGPTTVVAQAADNSANITLGHGNGLAVIEGLDSGEEIGVLLGELSKLDEQGATGLGGGLLPLALKGLAGGGYG